MNDDTPAFVLRRYPGYQFEAALDVYEADLPEMAAKGYVPAGQVWGWDPVGSAGWLISGSSWKPGIGTLAVTYRLERRAEHA